MELAKRFCEEEKGDAKLFYLWGHSFEFERENNWHVIEDFLTYMKKFSDTIWMATNGEIVDYVTALAYCDASDTAEMDDCPT